MDEIVDRANAHVLHRSGIRRRIFMLILENKKC